MSLGRSSFLLKPPWALAFVIAGALSLPMSMSRAQTDGPESGAAPTVADAVRMAQEYAGSSGSPGDAAYIQAFEQAYYHLMAGGQLSTLEDADDTESREGMRDVGAVTPYATGGASPDGGTTSTADEEERVVTFIFESNDSGRDDSDTASRSLARRADANPLHDIRQDSAYQQNHGTLLSRIANERVTPYVYGGEPTRGLEERFPDFETYPDFSAVVAILVDGKLQCSGSVIGSSVVLTAAHCLCHENNNEESAEPSQKPALVKVSPVSRFSIALGADVSQPDRSPLPVHDARAIVDCAEGQSVLRDGDLAVLFVSGNLQSLASVSPLASSDLIDEASTGKIVGYGKTGIVVQRDGSEQDLSGVKLFADVPIASNNCTGSYISESGTPTTVANHYSCRMNEETGGGPSKPRQGKLHG